MIRNSWIIRDARRFRKLYEDPNVLAYIYHGFPPREPWATYHPDAVVRYIRVAEKRRRLWWHVSNNAGTKWARLLGRTK